MKRFIFEVFVLSLIVCLPFYIIQSVIDGKAKRCYKPPYSSFNYIYNAPLNADIAIFGNSRVQCHYYGDLMDTLLHCSCYNLGLNGYSFDYQYNLQMLPYLHNNQSPRLIILEVGPQAFFAHWNDDFRKEFLPYLNVPQFDFYLDMCAELSFVDRILPIKYYGWGIKELFDFYNYMTDTLLDNRYKDCFEPCVTPKYHVNFPDTIYSLEHDNVIIHYFTEFIDTCKAKEIPLLLVCSPMHREDFYDKCRMDEFWQLIDSLAPNVPKLDYSLMFGSDTTYFAESTHLNLLGAELFTTKLAHDIDSIGFLK